MLVNKKDTEKHKKQLFLWLCKYLGIRTDWSLDWNEQIKVFSAMVSRAIGFLKEVKKYLLRETLENNYKKALLSRT